MQDSPDRAGLYRHTNKIHSQSPRFTTTAPTSRGAALGTDNNMCHHCDGHTGCRRAEVNPCYEEQQMYRGPAQNHKSITKQIKPYHFNLIHGSMGTTSIRHSSHTKQRVPCILSSKPHVQTPPASRESLKFKLTPRSRCLHRASSAGKLSPKRNKSH